METILKCQEVSCVRENWRAGAPSRVDRVTAEFTVGSFCGFTGEDGCGKGLLLNVLGLLEKPDAGEVEVAGRPTVRLEAAEATRFRNDTFGFLFAQAGLLPGFSVLENVAMPLFRIRGEDPDSAECRTLEVLEFCECSEARDDLAETLDCATAARASLARALVHGPKIVIAIAPKAEETLLPLASRAASNLGICILWAGGALALSRHAHRILEMRAGRIAEEMCLV